MLNRYFPVTKYPTDIPGLLYRPSIEPEYSDRADHIEPFHSIVMDETTPDQCYSAWNRMILVTELEKLGLDVEGATGLILEIGVAIVTDSRPFENTSTYILTTPKADSVMYYGIDIVRDKNVESNPDKNIYYHLGIDSWQWLQYAYPAETITSLPQKIDLIHIDGNHSVRGVLNDWQYTELLKPGGVAVFHDTNVHPGPATVLDAVDPNLFSVRQYSGVEPGDFGMAVVRRQRITP